MPNLVLFWTGEFKKLDHQGRGYIITNSIWKEIGAATEACSATIPVAFGAVVFNIFMKQSQMMAEKWSVWTFYIAPVVLHRRFKKDKYYKHFIKLIKLVKLCLAYKTWISFLTSTWYHSYNYIGYTIEMTLLGSLLAPWLFTHFFIFQEISLWLALSGPAGCIP